MREQKEKLEGRTGGYLQWGWWESSRYCWEKGDRKELSWRGSLWWQEADLCLHQWLSRPPLYFNPGHSLVFITINLTRG